MKNLIILLTIAGMLVSCGETAKSNKAESKKQDVKISEPVNNTAMNE